MEVILIKPVKKLGTIGSLVTVNNGFGRNWLIPKQLAIRATLKNKQLIASQKHDLEEQNKQAQAKALSVAELIANNDLIFIRQAAADGKLFGSVGSKEIAQELSNIAAQPISKGAVALRAPLKMTGVFAITINLHHEVTASIIVTIARSESEAQDALRAFKDASVNYLAGKEIEFK